MFTPIQLFFHKVVVIYGIGAMALVIYMTKFPERAFPGEDICSPKNLTVWNLSDNLYGSSVTH